MIFETILSAYRKAVVAFDHLAIQRYDEKFIPFRRRKRQVEAFEDRLLTMWMFCRSGAFHDKFTHMARTLAFAQADLDYQNRRGTCINSQQFKKIKVLEDERDNLRFELGELRRELILLEKALHEEMSGDEVLDGLWQILYPGQTTAWEYRSQPLVHIRTEIDAARAACREAFKVLAQSNTYSPAENAAWKILGTYLGVSSSDQLEKPHAQPNA